MFGIVGAIYVVIGVPLARGRVRPNAWYGFRTPKTFSSPTIWYEANRIAGIDLIIGGVVIIVGVVALLLVRTYILPTLPAESWSFALFLATMIVVAAHSFWALSRM
jgi:uncharacterized membrane protein